MSRLIGCSQKLETFNAHQKLQKRLRVLAVAFYSVSGMFKNYLISQTETVPLTS